MNINVTGQDFQAVAKQQAEQIVNLQATMNALSRLVVELEAEHAKCPKEAKDAATRTEG